MGRSARELCRCFLCAKLDLNNAVISSPGNVRIKGMPASLLGALSSSPLRHFQRLIAIPALRYLARIVSG